jgi:short-subunit dehydrogenase
MRLAESPATPLHGPWAVVTGAADNIDQDIAFHLANSPPTL